MKAYVLLPDYGYEGLGEPEAVWLHYPTEADLKSALEELLVPKQAHSGYNLETLQKEAKDAIEEAVPLILAGQRSVFCSYIISECEVLERITNE